MKRGTAAWLLLTLLGSAACGKGGGNAATYDAVCQHADASTTPDTATGPDAGPDSLPPPWEPEPLPPCDRACDRVLDCGVEACVGHDWMTAGRLFEQCYVACEQDAELADEALGAGGCEGALAAYEARAPGFSQECSENPCESTCTFYGGCVEEICPAVDGQLGAQLAQDCRGWCTPDVAAFVLGLPGCQDLLDVLIQDDPATWQPLCYGGTKECADETVCGPYVEKVAGCFVEHCDPEAAAYTKGLKEALFSWCTTGEDCPTQGDVQNVLGAAFTCDNAPLADIGPAPPFDVLCYGEGGVSPEELGAICDKLLGCPGTEGIGTPDMCMVLLGVRPDVVPLSACLEAAPACTELFACLEDAG